VEKENLCITPESLSPPISSSEITILGLTHIMCKVKYDKHCDLNLHFEQLTVYCYLFFISTA